MTKATITVKGMSCASCEVAVRTSLMRLEGVLRVEPDHRSDRVAVRFDPARVSEEQIKERIQASGYDVT